MLLDGIALFCIVAAGGIVDSLDGCGPALAGSEVVVPFGVVLFSCNGCSA